MITFKQWEIKSDFKVFSVQKDGYHIAKLLLDERNQFNSILTFESRIVYSARKVAEISHAIWAEFGDIEFKIMGG